MTGVPREWQATRLGDHLSEPIRNGYSPRCPRNPTGRWMLSLAAVTPNGFNPSGVKPAPTDDPKLDLALLFPGDILVSRSNTRERVGLAGMYGGQPEACAYPDLLMRVRTAPSLDTNYLGQALLARQGRKYFQRLARGTSGSMVKIDRAILESFPLLLPPLPEQRKIATILSSVDATIEKTEAVVEQLQIVKKAMMQELFTRGLPGRHTRFKNTVIGEVPEEWKVVRLAEVALVQTGMAKGKSTNAETELVPYLRVANVQDGYVDLSELKTVEVPRAAFNRYSLRPGDVLFTEGGDADKLGRGCVWSGQVDPCLHQNHIFAVRPKTDVILPQFLSYFGGSPAGKKYFLGCSKQTTNLASINSSQLKALPVPLASLDEQEAIVSTIGSVDAYIVRERECEIMLRSMKSSLMSVLLTGECRVTPDEAIL